MKLISVNVGLPREVVDDGEVVLTSIFKSPVEGRVRVRFLNLDGDRQSDLTVHGGQDKAVYGYASEHYPKWRRELPDNEFPWGAFGENLTTEGLLEDTLAIGDTLQIGSAELVVTQPRLPCFKLGIRHARPDIVKLFMRSLRSGFYFKVSKEGELGAGDAIEHVPFDGERVTVRELFSLFLPNPDRSIAERVVSVPALPESWRARFKEELERHRQ